MFYWQVSKHGGQYLSILMVRSRDGEDLAGANMAGAR